MTPHAFSPRSLRRLAAISAGLLTIAIASPAFSVPRLPAANPSISALHLAPVTVAHGGGTVQLTGTIHHATSCRVSSSPSLSGLPTTHTCSSGHLAVALHVGADPHAALRHLTITVRATKGSHHVTHTITLTQAAAPAPTVTNIKVSPAQVAAAGGTVHLSATVGHTTNCTLSVSPALSGLPANTTCSGSSYSHAVTLPADTTATAHSYVFTLKVIGAGGSKTASTHPMATVTAGSAAAISKLSSDAAPLPADSQPSSSEDATLTSVSCASAGHCVAVGNYYEPPSGGASVDQAGLIETLNGTTWTASEAPWPTDVSTSEPAVQLTSVACISSIACTAVGQYLASTMGFEPYVATLSGTKWTWQPASVPPDPNSPYTLNASLAAVSCGPDAGCVAVGTSRPYGDLYDAFIEQPVSGGWTGSEAPVPSNADPERGNPSGQSPYVNDRLTSVSCTSSTSCTAVGDYTIGSGGSLGGSGFGDTLSGTTWTATEIPASSEYGSETAVSCAGSDCAGTGRYGTTGAAIQTEVSGVWSSGDSIAAPVPPTDNSADFSAVDCASASSCVFVGDVYDSTDTYNHPLIDTGSGTSYSETQPSLPSDSKTGGDNLTAVSCPAVGSCGVVGQYSATDGDGTLFEAATTTGGTTTWTPSEVPLPNAGSDAASLTSVSCIADWGCISVGVYSPDGEGETADGAIVSAPL